MAAPRFDMDEIEWAHVGVDHDTLLNLPFPDDVSAEVMEGVRIQLSMICNRAIKNSVDAVRLKMADMNDYYYERLSSLTEEKDTLQEQHEQLENEVNVLTALVNRLVKQFNNMAADSTGSATGTKSKMPDPPTFSGSDNKGDLEDWIRQIKLYTKHMAIHSDSQQIVYALSRVRSPATKYLTSYFTKNAEDQDLGSWQDFIKVLRGIYGQKDEKAGAKEEFTALWANKSLAHRDFIKYSEQFKTLASIVEYKDDVLIDKLNEVLPEKLATAVGIAETFTTMPSKWDEYLDKLLELYKKIEKSKTGTRIFGKDKETTSNDKSGSSSRTKEANSAGTSKPKKFCQICSGKGKAKAAQSHNTADCYDKEGNESKRPQPKASSSGTNTASRSAGATWTNTGKGKSQQGNKSYKAKLLEMLNNLPDDDDDQTNSAGTVNVNSARIETIDEEEEVENLLGTASSSRKTSESHGSAKSDSLKSTSAKISGFLKGM